jgi:hypothetical protein
MEEIKKRLISKKLWIAVAGAIYFGLQGDAMAVLTIVVGYLGIQGLIDLKN